MIQKTKLIDLKLLITKNILRCFTYIIQLKLLRTETSRANEDRKRYEEMLRKARSLVQKEIDKQWWASIFRFVKRQVEASLNTTSENHRKKLEKLSERQDKPLGGRNERSVKVLDNIELPEWVYKVLIVI